MAKKRLLISCAVMLITALVLGHHSNVLAKEILIRVTHVATQDWHPYNVGIKKFAEVLDQKTNGQVKVKNYLGGQLTGAEKDMAMMVQEGAVEMAIIANAPLSTFVEAIGLFSLAYIFKDLDHANRIMNGPVGKEIAGRLDKKGIMIMTYIHGGGFRSVFNHVRPIQTPEDLKGMKIRVMKDPVYVETFKAFGAIPTPLAWGELHSALEQGVVDAAENNPMVYAKYGFIPMAKYYSLTEHTFAPTPVIFSKKIFDQYPPAIQKAVLEAAQEMIPAARVAVDKTLEEAYDSISKDGGIVNKVNKERFIQAAQPAIKKLGDKIDPDLLQQILATE